MLKKRLLQVLGFLLAACSCVFALEIAIQAVIFTCAIYFGGSLAYLKAVGIMLCILFVFHVFPVSLARTRRRLLVYSASAVASAAIFGVLYSVAEIGDPFQSEGRVFRIALFFWRRFFVSFLYSEHGFVHLLLWQHPPNRPNHALQRTEAGGGVGPEFDV